MSWTKEEQVAINKAFRRNIATGVIPLHHDVLVALKNYPALRKRDAKKIKDKVRNDIVKQKKKGQKQ